MIVAPTGAKHLLCGTGTTGQIPQSLNTCQPLKAVLAGNQIQKACRAQTA